MTTYPHRPRVKICGITNAADLSVALAAGADAVGVIADVPVDSPREVSVGRAAALLDTVPPFATSVLVTMAADAEAVLDLVDRVAPDVVQLHGGLPPDELAIVTKHVRVIAAHSTNDSERIVDAAPLVDAILLDALDAEGGGGTGRTADWERARTYVEELAVPIVLAGGLDQDNVAAAIDAVGPYAVDVATGVARADDATRKDADAVRAFVRAAQRDEEVQSTWSP